MQTYYCPKCGSEDVLDLTKVDLPADRQAALFCENCHKIGTREQFSKKPYFWNWQFWRLRPIPALLTIGLYFCIPASGSVRLAICIAIYALLSSITLRRRDGRRVFPPYMW
jgi:hypothetical protein